MISQSIYDCAYQKAEQSGDQIIQFAFAATGGAGAWSVSGERHANPKYQPADEISDDVCCGDVWEGD